MLNINKLKLAVDNYGGPDKLANELKQANLPVSRTTVYNILSKGKADTHQLGYICNIIGIHPGEIFESEATKALTTQIIAERIKNIVHVVEKLEPLLQEFKTLAKA